MSTENRYMRIEDWQGNVYYPEVNSAGTTAGSVINSSNASDDPESSVYTEGTIISDPDANGGKSITQKTLSESDSILFRTDIDNITLGNIVINIRAKINSLGTGSFPVIKVKAEYINGDDSSYVPYQLSISEIYNVDFGTIDKFVNLSVFTEFKLPPNPGQATTNHILRITVIAVGGINVRIYFDQLAVQMAMGSNSRDESASHFNGLITNSSSTKSDILAIAEYYSAKGLIPFSGDLIIVKDSFGNENTYIYNGINFSLMDKRTLEKYNALAEELKHPDLAAYKTVAKSINSDSPSDNKVPTEKGLVEYVSGITSEFGTSIYKNAETSIPKTASDDNIPTSKAVKDYIGSITSTYGAVVTKNVDEIISTNPSNSNVPTSKAVYDLVATKLPTGTAASKDFEDTLIENSTKLPTSKAIATYIASKIVIPTGTAATLDFTKELGSPGTDVTLPTSKAIITYLNSTYKAAATKDVSTSLSVNGNKLPTENAVASYIKNHIKYDTSKSSDGLYAIVFDFNF